MWRLVFYKLLILYIQEFFLYGNLDKDVGSKKLPLTGHGDVNLEHDRSTLTWIGQMRFGHKLTLRSCPLTRRHAFKCNRMRHIPVPLQFTSTPLVMQFRYANAPNNSEQILFRDSQPDLVIFRLHGLRQLHQWKISNLYTYMHRYHTVCRIDLFYLFCTLLTSDEITFASASMNFYVLANLCLKIKVITDVRRNNVPKKTTVIGLIVLFKVEITPKATVIMKTVNSSFWWKWGY